jgi:hypothetical protein
VDEATESLKLVGRGFRFAEIDLRSVDEHGCFFLEYLFS